jgi:hypothetical protein
MENFTTRFIIENRTYYFQWEWGTEQFSCQVTDGKYAWDGKADQKYIETHLKPEGMELSEIMLLLKHCMREQDIQQKRFSYQIYAGQVQGDIIFGWKIKIEDQENDDGDIFIKGNLPLKRQNPHLIIQNIFENFYSKFSMIQKQNETLMKSNQKLQEQRDDALKQMKQMTEDKITMEHELMQKFVLVLNEKKKKIRELTDKVNVLTDKVNVLIDKVQETQKLVVQKQQIPELKYEEIKIRVIEPKKKNRMPVSSYPTFGIDSINSNEIQLLDESDPVKTLVRKRHRNLNNPQDIDATAESKDSQGLNQEQSQGLFVFKSVKSPKMIPSVTSPVTSPVGSSVSLALTTKLLKKKELDADDLLEFVLHHQ